MASPFKLFRKYQKQAFLGLGLMAILSFIVLPAMLQSMGARPGARVIFAKSRFGTIGQLELQNLEIRRQRLIQFYQQLIRAVYAATQKESPALQSTLRRLMVEGESRDDELISDWIVAQYMIEQGHRPDNDTLKAFLLELTGQQLTEDIFRTATEKLDISNSQLFTLIWENYLVQQMYGMRELSVMAVTPSKHFEWHNRLNRMMKIEAAGIPVNHFVSEVAEPSPRELKKFFEENKFRENRPVDPEAGFTIPKMVTCEYVKFDESMIDLNAVTDEEIQQYYETNKDILYKNTPPSTASGVPTAPNPFGSAAGRLNLGSPATTPTLPTTTSTPATDSQTPVTTPAAPVETQSTETPSTEPAPAQQPTPEKSVPETTPAGTPASEPASVPENKSENKTDETKNETNSSSRWNANELPIHLVSYQSETAADATPANAAPTTTEPAASETTVPVPVATIPQTPATPVPTPLPLPGAGSGSGLSGNGSLSPNMNFLPPANLQNTPTYKSFDDVKEEIRKSLALGKLRDRLLKIQVEMQNYYDAVILHTQRPDTAEPKRPDLAAMARDNGLKHVNLGKIDYFALLEKDIDFASARMTSEKYRNLGVIAVLFGQSGIVTNSPFTAENTRIQTEYVFWVSEIEEPRVPKFTDTGVAEQVKNRWKEIEARKLAQQKAGELAETFRKSEKTSLVEFFTANKSDAVQAVVGTEYFSWNQIDYMGMREGRGPGLGEIRETGVPIGESISKNVLLRYCGDDDFMRSVFSLDLGQVGVTANRPQNMFYVIRMADVSPTDDAAFLSFKSVSPMQNYFTALYARRDRTIQLHEGLQNEIMMKTGFTWVMKPSQYQLQQKFLARERALQGDGGNVPPPSQGRGLPILPEF
ncbi:MAG: hypothetical protein FWC50_09055 [Planctomycetaceae bacterium]|nr:hypothetical protein [Planctomycetaceae bacterium]